MDFLEGGGGGINDTCIRAPWATPGTRTSQTDDPSTARVAFKSTVQSLET